MVLYNIPEALMGTMIGFAGGIVLGLAARIGRFCTLGAIEDALYGQSNNRLRMWGTAIGMAVLLVCAYVFRACSLACFGCLRLRMAPSCSMALMFGGAFD